MDAEHCGVATEQAVSESGLFTFDYSVFISSTDFTSHLGIEELLHTIRELLYTHNPEETFIRVQVRVSSREFIPS